MAVVGNDSSRLHHLSRVHVLLMAGLILSGAKGEVTQVSQKDSDVTAVEMVPMTQLPKMSIKVTMPS